VLRLCVHEWLSIRSCNRQAACWGGMGQARGYWLPCVSWSVREAGCITETNQDPLGPIWHAERDMWALSGSHK
jgi:hypothetical protein